MLRQGREIADSLVVMAICIGLPVVGLSYVRNIPDPIAKIARADGVMRARADPETTGALSTTAEGRAFGVEASPSEAKTGSAAWIDPPRRYDAAERSTSATVDTMELRLPRP